MLDFKKLKTSVNKLPEVLVYVEISKDSYVKYEVDEETGFLMADRFLYTAMKFPFNYGFIPNSMSEDNDPTDVMILSSESVIPGVVVKCKVIGMLQMKDEAGIDTKIIAVPVLKIDPLYGKYNDITDVPSAVKEKIKHFFDHYKELEPNKWVKTEKFLGKEAAMKAVKKSLLK
jgi:inorganic pyrophosphatase